MSGTGLFAGQSAEDDLSEILDLQIAAVDRRVRLGGGVYAEEAQQIRMAAKWVRVLRVDLGLGPLVESLTPETGKPQVLFAFDSADHGAVVLKVYGTSRPGEAAAQQFWVSRGVRSVPILASGDTPVSWLLMRRIPTAPLELGGQLRLQSVTRELAETMQLAHVCHEEARHITRHLVPSWLRHLTIVVGVLNSHGYSTPDDWSDVVHHAGETGRQVLLHADLAPGNIMRDRRDGQLRIFDASGKIGPVAFDAARWCARTAGALEADQLLHDWLSVEHTIDRAQAMALLGVEMMMEAGVNELVKAEKGQPFDQLDERTISYLSQSTRLLNEYR